jgi:two-component system, NarL family, nitrate/nitrite response regulator NarL
MVREESGSKAIIDVLVADNTVIHTQLLGAALQRDRGLRVTSWNSEVKSLIDATLEHHFDVLVISSSLEEQPDRGLEVLRSLWASRPKLRAVALLDSSQAELILKAFRAGARGVLTRFESLRTLSKCVRCVHKGQIWARSEHLSLALEALVAAHPVHVADVSSLSKREMEIVQSLAEGLTNREIAQRLGLSQHTIKNYLFRVFDKTGASNRIELLFMLSGQNNGSSSMLNDFSTMLAAGDLSAAGMTNCQQAAERGVLAAQVVLAQLLLRRKATPDDIVDSYKWYLIAKSELLQAGKTVSQGMTMEQRLHAEQMASDWLKKTQQSTTFSDTNVMPQKRHISDSTTTDISSRTKSRWV